MEKKAPHIVIIETERLLLREWAEADIAPFAEINRNERVMEYFRCSIFTLLIISDHSF